ncbi:YqaA family protein [Sinimarinibacterium sp. NLF-5-8]|uniref:YqaA family protein n=1 Tax=Sinimarinibacterium sp. NLF-5-8 TaxID=2698684 RepID=UPI00137BF3D0|nr:YqaA family protein [Sinimarinibacterium sp. NLF-5-8]QHS11433.1 DedA family protein [Sinimarinibacterium sp. NLF-5-8]
MWDVGAYLGLLASAFVAATLLPLQSEAVLSALLLAAAQPVWALLLVATVGNVLGSIVNWWLGRWIERFRDRRWFAPSAEALARAQLRYQRYGYWSLLLSWAPIIGDPLTLVAGVMREPLLRFVLIVTLAKAARYAVIAMLVLGWA